MSTCWPATPSPPATPTSTTGWLRRPGRLAGQRDHRPAARARDDPLDLRPVTILWITDWWDGPVEGMATYQDRDCWFRAIFDTSADEWTSPRRCRLYELAPDERQRLWARHRFWEQYAGGGSCFHPDAPDPALKPGSQDFYQHADREPARTGAQIGEFTAPPMQPARRDARTPATHSPSRP